MEIFGGFMVMMSILSLFMAAVWLVMPFVVFAIKGKLDRTLDLLEKLENRMSGIESQLVELKNSVNNKASVAKEEQTVVPTTD